MYLFPGVLYSSKLLRKHTLDYSLIVIQNSTSKKIAHKLNKSINEGRSNDLYLAKIDTLSDLPYIQPVEKSV